MPERTTTHRPTEPERPSRTLAPASAPEALPPAATARASEVVAQVDRALASLDASGDLSKKMREQARALVRGATVSSAAGFLAAAAVSRERLALEGDAEAEQIVASENAARALLEAAGARADVSPAQPEEALRRELIPDAAPAGTVLRVISPSWRSGSGEPLAPGVALASSGPRPLLEAPLERAFRAARRLAKRAEDVTTRASELSSGLAGLDGAGQIQRALDAVRFLEALAAIHATPGQDVAEAGLADLVLFLEARGVRRVPATGARVERPIEAKDDPGEPDSLETEHVSARLVPDASPVGTVLKRIRSAFVQGGQLVDGAKAEVVVSRGLESEDERRLETLARAETPGSALPRALAKWRKLGDARHGEAGARVLLELVRELGRAAPSEGPPLATPVASRLTRGLPKKSEPTRGESVRGETGRPESSKAESARAEALALAVRLLESLGAVRLEPRDGAAPGEVAVAERVADSRPEGSVVRVLEAGWRLGARVLEPAKVVLSLGPQAALPGLIRRALDSLSANDASRELRELVSATWERVQGLPASELEGTGGLAAALDLAMQLEDLGPGPAAADAVRRRQLGPFLAARGITSFPDDETTARAGLEQDAAAYEVATEPSETPRGDVTALVARGFRDAQGKVLRRARVRVSRGPEDPLARALGVLAAAIEGSPVPGASPLARINALRAAVAGGVPLSPDEALARTLDTVRAAQLLAETCRPEWARAIHKALDEAVFPTLGACGVEVFPAPGANALAPSQAGRVEPELRDAREAPGALLEVKRRGLARGETVYPAVVVLSRGPRPRLLDAAGIAAQGGGVLEPLAALAADLAKRLEDARRALALGSEGEGKARDQAFDAGLAFLRAAERLRAGLADPTERASLDSFLEGQVRPALALAHEQVEVFPISPEGLDGRELERDPAYEVELVHDGRAPLGAVLSVVRAGVRDRRPRTPLVERAKVTASLGPRPPVELALDEILAAASLDPLAPPGLDDRVRAVREAARAVVRARSEPATPRLREVLGQAAAALLDALEPRIQEGPRAPGTLARLLDEALLPALRSLGVRPFPEDGEAVSERPSGRIEVAREHSDSAPRGSVIRRVRRGLEVEGRSLRPARIVISLGPRDDVATLASDLETLLRDMPATARPPLEQALARERAAVEEGRASANPTERALALVDSLDEALARAGDPARAGLHERLAPVAAALGRMGLELFPRKGEPVPEAVRLDPAALELDGTREFSGGARGSVVAVARLGVRQGNRVVRPGKARLDLGPRPAWLDAAEEAARAGASLGPLLEKVRDPRQALDDAALVLELHDAHLSCPAARASLERALAALGAQVFPRAGEPLPQGLAPDSLATVSVYSDELPAGSVVRTGASGLSRAGVLLRPARVEVSRGPMSPSLKAVGELALATGLAEPVRAALAKIAARLEALPPEQHATDEADRAVAEALAVLEAANDPAGEATASGVARLVSVLRERGYVVAPDGPGGSIDSLKATLGGDAALEPPRRRFGSAQPGEILAVERRAVTKGEHVLSKARVLVCAGAPNELHGIVSDVRDKLALESGDATSVKELDDVLERLADAKPERIHLLAFPVMNVLHRRNLKDKLGAELKAYLRSKHVKEIVAYAGFPATELGPKQLEEVRVNSDRDKGKIVRVLRPGFVEEKTGAILQKVQAEVSR